MFNQNTPDSRARMLKAIKRIRFHHATIVPWATAGGLCLVDRQSPGGIDYCSRCDGSENGPCNTHRKDDHEDYL